MRISSINSMNNFNQRITNNTQSFKGLWGKDTYEQENLGYGRPKEIEVKHYYPFKDEKPEDINKILKNYYIINRKAFGISGDVPKIEVQRLDFTQKQFDDYKRSKDSKKNAELYNNIEAKLSDIDFIYEEIDGGHDASDYFEDDEATIFLKNLEQAQEEEE